MDTRPASNPYPIAFSRMRRARKRQARDYMAGHGWSLLIWTLSLAAMMLMRLVGLMFVLGGGFMLTVRPGDIPLAAGELLLIIGVLVVVLAVCHLFGLPRRNKAMKIRAAALLVSALAFFTFVNLMNLEAAWCLERKARSFASYGEAEEAPWLRRLFAQKRADLSRHIFSHPTWRIGWLYTWAVPRPERDDFAPPAAR